MAAKCVSCLKLLIVKVVDSVNDPAITQDNRRYHQYLRGVLGLHSLRLAGLADGGKRIEKCRKPGGGGAKMRNRAFHHLALPHYIFPKGPVIFFL